MTFRKPKPPMNTTEKIAALKALRGQHDQRIRCEAIEILYGTGGETARFLEDAIQRLEFEEGMSFPKAQLWQPGYAEDGD